VRRRTATSTSQGALASSWDNCASFPPLGRARHATAQDLVACRMPRQWPTGGYAHLANAGRPGCHLLWKVCAKNPCCRNLIPPARPRVPNPSQAMVRSAYWQVPTAVMNGPASHAHPVRLSCRVVPEGKGMRFLFVRLAFTRTDASVDPQLRILRKKRPHFASSCWQGSPLCLGPYPCRARAAVERSTPRQWRYGKAGSRRRSLSGDRGGSSLRDEAP
jgi:hypothetical protein